jgi:phosphatidate cytidylyltransferase
VKNLLSRLLTGAVFVTLVLGSIYLGTWYFLVLFGFFTFVGTWEYLRMAEAKWGAKINKLPASITSLISFVLVYIVLSDNNILPVEVLFIPFLLVFILFSFEYIVSRTKQWSV